MVPGAISLNTYGVGPHGETPRDLPMMSERSNVLLVPINLQWAGRSLSELLEETKHLPREQKTIFNQVFEETRTRPDIDIPAYVAQIIIDDDPAIIKVSRYAIYAAQLWRREWLIELLMEHSVILDSNFWPDHLAKKIENCRATVLSNAQVHNTDRRSLACRGVLTCSSSHDLYHDRVANGFNHGCIMVAEQNAVYPVVQSDAGMIYYDFDRVVLDGIVETLSSSHPDDLQAMAAAGKKRLSDIYPNMGWTHFFDAGRD